MCDPATIAISSTILGGIQSFAGLAAAQSSYNSQVDSYNQNAENATRTTTKNYSNLNIRLQQEQQAAAQEKQQGEIDRAKAVASTEVAAAAGGVSGLSVDAVLRDIYAQSGRNEATADANLRMTKGYLQGELDAAEISGQSQINSMPIPEKPSPVPYLMNAFSTGLSAYTTKLQMEN